jgi:hypothetical protein
LSQLIALFGPNLDNSIHILLSGLGTTTPEERVTQAVEKAVPWVATRSQVASAAKKVAADRSAPRKIRSLAGTWERRRQYDFRAVCSEIREAAAAGGRSSGSAAASLASVTGKWEASALRLVNLYMRVKAFIPVLVTAFIDGAFVLHRVVDPKDLSYNGVAIATKALSFSIYVPAVIIAILIGCAIAQWISRWCLRRMGRVYSNAAEPEPTRAGKRKASPDDHHGRNNDDDDAGDDNDNDNDGDEDSGAGEAVSEDTDKRAKRWWIASRVIDFLTMAAIFAGIVAFGGTCLFGIFLKLTTIAALAQGNIDNTLNLLQIGVDTLYVVVSTVVVAARFGVVATIGGGKSRGSANRV